MNRIYCDHNATTPVAPEVIEVMAEAMKECPGNPSSTHSSGRQARQKLEDAREVIASFAGVSAREIVFTSGGTESDNLAVRGYLNSVEGKGNVVTSNLEHPAIYDTFKSLEEEGYEIRFIPGNESGIVSVENVLDHVDDDTKIVSLMYANNETGVINPIPEIAKVLKERGIVFHTDAVQYFGKQLMQLKELGVDMMSASAHKIYGPKGIGALYVRDGLLLEKEIHGGPQEREVRAGTENFFSILGFAKAVELCAKNWESRRKKALEMRDAFEKAVLKKIPDSKIMAGDAVRLDNTSCIMFPGCKADMLVMGMDIRGIDISAGSACAAGAVKYSRIIHNMGYDQESAASTLRFSFGEWNELDQLEGVVQALGDLVGLQRG